MEANVELENDGANIGSVDKEAKIGSSELILLCAVLVLAHHAIPYWVVTQFFDARSLFEQIGRDGWQLLMHGAQGIMPLLLCLTCIRRSGLVLGTWRKQLGLVVLVVSIPIVLTAIIYPLTSTPFSNSSISTWLISPIMQDLLFSGYLYGLLRGRFAKMPVSKLPINTAMLITAMLFAFWHVPNFHGMAAAYVSFQLLYTFIGLVWALIAREITGSIIPVVVIHMCVNYLAWLDW